MRGATLVKRLLSRLLRMVELRVIFAFEYDATMSSKRILDSLAGAELPVVELALQWLLATNSERLIQVGIFRAMMKFV